MHELVILSGKGGTGKTSLVAALAELARPCVLADCDVDAADLHLLLAPVERQRHRFTSGHLAVIDQRRCVACGGCLTYCRCEAVRMRGNGAGEATFTVDPLACEGCGACVSACPVQAIDWQPRLAGEWFLAETACGPLVHARLQPAAENSGKLVTLVRQEARRQTLVAEYDRILVDGPPGIGCPVIASLTGASQVLVVTEPTVSGAHDAERVLELAAQLETPAVLCVNKWDLNPQQTDRLEALAQARGVRTVGRIPYDPAMTAALRQGRSILHPDYRGSAAATAIRHLWEQL